MPIHIAAYPKNPILNSQVKLSQFKKAINVSDEEIYEYYKENGESKTRSRYGVGSSRIQRIDRQLGKQIKRRRKTTQEQDTFICDTAYNSVVNSPKIKKLCRKDFHLLVYLVQQ